MTATATAQQILTHHLVPAGEGLYEVRGNGDDHSFSSPLPLQKAADLLARTENGTHFEDLSWDSLTGDQALELLGMTAHYTAAAHEMALAVKESKASYASFQRCDTDGARTQAASDGFSRMHSAQADLHDRGGKHTFDALFTAHDLTRTDGQVIPAGTLIPAVQSTQANEYGNYTWQITNLEARLLLGSGYLNASKAKKEATRQANDAKKGFYLGTVRVEARADIYGMKSGGVAVCIRRTDGGFSADAEIIDNGQA